MLTLADTGDIALTCDSFGLYWNYSREEELWS